MLLNIYLGTTAISWATILIYGVACKMKIKRDGYKSVDRKESFMETLASFISLVFKCSLPVYNIINAIAIIWMHDKFFDYMEAELLKNGEIYKLKDEPAGTQLEMESLQFEKEQNNTDSIQKVNEKTYEDMLIEENIADLEKEKEPLLSQRVNISEVKLDQQGPVLKRTFNSKRI